MSRAPGESTRAVSVTYSGTGSWLSQGAVAGFLAGVGFIALNSWYATTTGAQALQPFQLIATLVQGPPPDRAMVWIGMVVHVVLSILLGVLFVALLAPLRGHSPAWLPWAGLLFGAGVYLVDFQVLSRFVPQFGAFLQATNQPFELSVHLAFGAVLAALLTAGFRQARH